VAGNPLARQVKLADLADNLDPARVAKLAPDMRAKLEAKYREASEILDGLPSASDHREG
jgi:hypothetical protein